MFISTRRASPHPRVQTTDQTIAFSSTVRRTRHSCVSVEIRLYRTHFRKSIEPRCLGIAPASYSHAMSRARGKWVRGLCFATTWTIIPTVTNNQQGEGRLFHGQKVGVPVKCSSPVLCNTVANHFTRRGERHVNAFFVHNKNTDHSWRRHQCLGRTYHRFHFATAISSRKLADIDGRFGTDLPRLQLSALSAQRSIHSMQFPKACHWISLGDDFSPMCHAGSSNALKTYY